MFTAYSPQAPLSEYIVCLWLVDGQVPYKREKILPTATIELMINFGSPHRLIDKNDENRYDLMTDSWVAGFQTEYLINEPVAETYMMGVRFKPGGAYPFFDFPISELSNFVIDMDVLWGGFIHEVRERLACTPTVQGKFRLLEAILCQRLIEKQQGIDAVRYAVQQLAQTQGRLAIRELSERIGISQKHLNTQFKKMVGVTPKNLAQVIRLQAVLHSIDPRHPINWSDIAHRYHYYDQAHFNRAFQAFTGLNPGTYVDLRTTVFGELAPGDNVHFVPIG